MLSREVKEKIAADYKIQIDSIKLLGAGDNGSVYRISSIDDKMPPFCVKAIGINNPSAKTEKDIAETYYKKDHFDVKTYQDDRYYYVTTPFYPGETLEAIITKQPSLNVIQRKAIFLELVNEIFKMHQLGILHRDLKAENILVENDNGKFAVHVIDFGRSTFVYDSNSGRALSTPHLLSLVNTTNSWSSYWFYPIFQFVRRWQPQTAPEYTSMISHRYGFFCEAESVGLRSDYYAVANLFARLMPEHVDWANEVLQAEIEHRTSKYYELINKVKEHICEEHIQLRLPEVKTESEEDGIEVRANCAANS